jgi:hypothetical protein
MSEQPRFDVLGCQRLTQQRIVQQIDLADRQIVGRAPVGVNTGKFVIGKLRRRDRL